MIYIVAHRRVPVPKLEGYVPLQVGGGEPFEGWLRDDTGDNIAGKNAGYCELTALYWIWKNRSDPHKGLVHYRRYFGRRRFSSRAEDIMPYDALCRLLERFDIIAAMPVRYHVNARDQLLIECCSRETFDRLEAIAAGLHPECMPAFRAFFARNRASQYNMMFCAGALFDEYCEWLFPMLFQLEPQLDLRAMNDYQRRVFGFLAERLLNVWMAHRELRVKALPVVSTAYTPLDHLTYFRRDVTNELRFRASRLLKH